MQEKNTLVWSVMQGFCSDQLSVRNSCVKFSLLGGERISRTTLLYGSSMGFNNLPYASISGFQVTLNDLWHQRGLQIDQMHTEVFGYPRYLLVREENERVVMDAWPAKVWVSQGYWRRRSERLLLIGYKLLLRRGVQQAELSGAFKHMLSQGELYSLKSRLENFHPQGCRLLNLHESFYTKYCKMFVILFGSQTLAYYRSVKDLAFMSGDFRRLLFRRTQFRELMGASKSLGLRPRFVILLYNPSNSLVVRSQNLPVLSFFNVLCRHKLQFIGRRRVGNLLRRTLWKSGRMFWDISVVKYGWPVRGSVLTSQDREFVWGNQSSFEPHYMSLYSHFKGTTPRTLKLSRAFPFLFGVSQRLG